MKSEGQVKQKLKQVFFRHRKRKIRDAVKKSPCNCKYNKKLELPDSFLSEFSDPQVCIYPDNLKTCDERIKDGLYQAQQCPFFESDVDVDNIKSLFRADLEDRNVVAMAEQYPDAAALMWMLGIENYCDLGIELEEEEEDG